jgi:hypothetical protein
MDQIEDSPHDLTKVEIPIMGTYGTNGPEFFEIVEDTLGAAHFPSGAFYSYVVCPQILSIYAGDDLVEFEP